MRPRSSSRFASNLLIARWTACVARSSASPRCTCLWLIVLSERRFLRREGATVLDVDAKPANNVIGSNESLPASPAPASSSSSSSSGLAPMAIDADSSAAFASPAGAMSSSVLAAPLLSRTARALFEVPDTMQQLESTRVSASGAALPNLAHASHARSDDASWTRFNAAAEPLYCFCRQVSPVADALSSLLTFWLADQVSAGEMIACDNSQCPYEWFHFSCVQLEEPPTGANPLRFCCSTRQHCFFCRAMVLQLVLVQEPEPRALAVDRARPGFCIAVTHRHEQQTQPAERAHNGTGQET